jgi:hypothetical protein
LNNFNSNLQICFFNDTPIYYLVNDILVNNNLEHIIETDAETFALFEIHIIKKIIEKLNKFKYLFYSIKYKKQFKDFFWLKIQKQKIENKYHPNNLINLLNNVSENDSVMFENILHNW